MGNVKQFPGKVTPIKEIAQDLLDREKELRTTMVVTRDKRGELSIMCYGPEKNHDDLLALKHIVGQYVDVAWADDLDATVEG